MAGIPGIDPRLWQRAVCGAAWLREQAAAGNTIVVVHHIDADGVTSGGVAAESLARAGFDFDTVPAKSLDDVHVARIQAGGHDALWFCDFGSTAYMHFPDTPKLVCDHHELVRDGTEESFPHVNPLLDDIPGSTISGAGCAFLVALALDAANLDLLPVALVGAAADLQDRKGGFSGANAAMVEAGRGAGLVEVARDLSWYGPETRPLRKFLGYANPGVPGATGDMRTAEAFLLGLGIPLKAGRKERAWSDLDADEQIRLQDGLVARLVDVGLEQQVSELWRDVVRICAASPGTPVRELQEFGTLLNSTARYGEPEIGLAVARGDRGAAYDAALDLLLDHRKHLVKSLDAFRTAGIEELVGIQTVHLRDQVRDTVVGIVCGMALDGLGLRKDMPLVGLAFTDDGRTKVSGRAPADIQSRIDLATAMRAAAGDVGGVGGGHRGAAGATIPRHMERQFLQQLDAIVAGQLGHVGSPGSASKLPSPAGPPERPVTGQTTLF